MAHRTKEQWADLIAEFKRSGKTQAQFARDNGVSAAALGWQLHGGYPKKKRTRARTKTNGHASASVFTRVGAAEMLEAVKGGVTLRIPVTVTADQLRVILEAL